VNGSKQNVSYCHCHSSHTLSCFKQQPQCTCHISQDKHIFESTFLAQIARISQHRTRQVLQIHTIGYPYSGASNFLLNEAVVSGRRFMDTLRVPLTYQEQVPKICQTQKTALILLGQLQLAILGPALLIGMPTHASSRNDKKTFAVRGCILSRP
jgi:hypothetical protein